MLKKTRNYIIPFLIIIIILLIVSNLHFIKKSKNVDNDKLEVIKYCPLNIDGQYNSKTKYYTTLNYKTFKKLMTKNTIATIGIVDSTSSTSNKFTEYVNKQSYYNNTNMYILDVSKLSKKDLIAFYELDEQLKDIEGSYIITIKKNKLLSITIIDNEQLNVLLERYGE